MSGPGSTGPPECWSRCLATRRPGTCGAAACPEADGIGKVRLTGLPPGRDVHYRVRAEDLDGRAASEPLVPHRPGRPRRRPIHLVGTWQVRGRQPGHRRHDRLRRDGGSPPDFFLA
ncbi:hypothetical protein [Actinokineospora iranica]|uniref:hypothetical protein n=1 Tax=Actinokineospora iranica TaxID=1271860 RepID=UPI001113B826|nr:hypothetical protein [Actinokineospora iranica]